MRLRLRSFLLTSALTFAPAVASATTISGLYVDGGSGYNDVQDQHVHANSPADGPAAQKFSINHGTGFTGFGAVGYGFGNGLRVEAEGLYNNSEDDYTQNVEENEPLIGPEPKITNTPPKISSSGGGGTSSGGMGGGRPPKQQQQQQQQQLTLKEIYNMFGSGSNVYSNGYGENKVVAIYPFNYMQSAFQSNGGLQPMGESEGNCDTEPPNYTWCGTYGGAPLIVVQKIDELPEWAAPPTITQKDDTNIEWEDTELTPTNPFGNGTSTTITGKAGIARWTGKDVDDVSCNDCYYISTLTPDQMQSLVNGSSFPNGMPSISNEMMPNKGGDTGLSGKEIPVVGPPLTAIPEEDSTYTAGTAYPNNTFDDEGSYAGGLLYDIETYSKTSGDNPLPKGYYYFQGYMGPETENNNECNSSTGFCGDVDGNQGQPFYSAPDQQDLDKWINQHNLTNASNSAPYNDTTSSNTPYQAGYYPYINPKNPGINGYYELTPLPTCNNKQGCSLNITPNWKQQSIYLQKQGIGDMGIVSGIGVTYLMPNEQTYPGLLASLPLKPIQSPSDPMGVDSENSQANLFAMSPASHEDMSLIQTSSPETARMIPRDQHLNFFAMRTVTSSYRVPVSRASLMSYDFPMRSVSYHGRDQSYGGFANVLYDFDLERLFGLRSIVTPFVGGGAGYLWQRYDDMGPVAAASITGVHGGFAWQGIAGVAFDTGISGLQVVAQYRMIGQPGSFYNGSFNYGTEGGHANFDQRFNHQFIVGFRYAFHNQPVHITPPSPSLPAALAAAAAPAPVPARSYLVFFDWNQYALTSRARQIVVEAAHATSYVHTTRINVNGYTDSSAAPGPAGQKYNYALSVKRARSVEAELIRNGVPASEIVIRGYGDSNPLVPTGPNTREPQNRRVEIILHA